MLVARHGRPHPRLHVRADPLVGPARTGRARRSTWSSNRRLLDTIEFKDRTLIGNRFIGLRGAGWNITSNNLDDSELGTTSPPCASEAERLPIAASRQSSTASAGSGWLTSTAAPGLRGRDSGVGAPRQAPRPRRPDAASRVVISKAPSRGAASPASGPACARSGSGGCSCAGGASGRSSVGRSPRACVRQLFEERGARIPPPRWPVPPRLPPCCSKQRRGSTTRARPRSRRCTGSTGSGWTSPPSSRSCWPSTTSLARPAVAAFLGYLARRLDGMPSLRRRDASPGKPGDRSRAARRNRQRPRHAAAPPRPAERGRRGRAGARAPRRGRGPRASARPASRPPAATRCCPPARARAGGRGVSPSPTGPRSFALGPRAVSAACCAASAPVRRARAVAAPPPCSREPDAPAVAGLAGCDERAATAAPGS